jgi:hypothetical protein
MQDYQIVSFFVHDKECISANIVSFSKHSILCFEGNILCISSAIVRPSIIKGSQDFG